VPAALAQAGQAAAGIQEDSALVQSYACWIRAFAGKTTPLFASTIITTASYLSPA
jgi:hypothetical protein